MTNVFQRKKANPQWIIAKAVVLPILAGTLLLILPWSSRSGDWTDPLTALFMATSAMCVTGHVVVDVGTYFSHFGQLVLLVLCQLGGLGFMTLAMFILILIGRRLSIQNEMVLNNALGVKEADEVKTLLWRTVIFTLILELAGTLIIAARLMLAHGFAMGRALYYGLFHAICAFCNAGLSLFPNNLIAVRSDKLILITVMALIVVGGLGFLVLHDVSQVGWWRRRPMLLRGRISLHSRVALQATVVLLVAGWITLAVLEWNRTLASLSIGNRLTCSLFQSVTARTCGFNVVDMAETHAATRFATVLLMFVGGSPGSTAGGIKTTTLVMLLAIVGTLIRGRQELTFQGRSVSLRVMEESLTIFLLSLLVVTALYGLLLLTEELNLAASRFTAEALMFEIVSAFGTVGLSTGIVPGFTDFGKLLLVAGMFIGRVGPLTVALVVSMKKTRQLVRYPEADVMVG